MLPGGTGESAAQQHPHTDQRHSKCHLFSPTLLGQEDKRETRSLINDFGVAESKQLAA